MLLAKRAHYEEILEHLKGTKALTKRHRGNRLHCLREVYCVSVSSKTFLNSFLKLLIGELYNNAGFTIEINCLNKKNSLIKFIQQHWNHNLKFLVGFSGQIKWAFYESAQKYIYWPTPTKIKYCKLDNSQNKSWKRLVPQHSLWYSYVNWPVKCFLHLLL